jgi:hypothetical protein
VVYRVWRLVWLERGGGPTVFVRHARPSRAPGWVCYCPQGMIVAGNWGVLATRQRRRRGGACAAHLRDHGRRGVWQYARGSMQISPFILQTTPIPAEHPP